MGNILSTVLLWTKETDYSFDTSRTLSENVIPTQFKVNLRCYYLPHSTIKDLYKHLKLDHPVFKCPYCYMEYGKNNELSRHLKLSVCSQLLPKEPKPRQKVVKKLQDYICNICALHSTSFKLIFDHMLDVHGDSLSCILCQENFNNKFRLLSHMQNHSKLLYCANHYTAFDTHQELVDHVNKPGHDLECGVCLRVFPSKAARIGHKRLHLGQQSNMSIKCPQCPLIYGSHATFKRHFQTFHEKSLQFLCDDCGKSFTTKYGLDLHLAKHHGKDTGLAVISYQCELCGNTLDSLTKLKAHKTQHYACSCDYCYEPFDDLQALKEHEEAANHQWFPCEICPDMKYKSNTLRQAHIFKIHENPEGANIMLKRQMKEGRKKRERKKREGSKWPRLENGMYYCKICQKQFRALASVERHFDLHSENPKYKCHCGKQFRQEQALKAHYSVHSDARPHVCLTCGKTFKERSSFYKHRKVHGWIPQRNKGVVDRPKTCVQYHPLLNDKKNTKNLNITLDRRPTTSSGENKTDGFKDRKNLVVISVPKKTADHSYASKPENGTDDDELASKVLVDLMNNDEEQSGSYHIENYSFYSRWNNR